MIFLLKIKKVSYIEFVDTILINLEFKVNMSGTRLLRDFVIYLYKEKPMEINIKDEFQKYVKIKNIKITYYNFIVKINNAINYTDTNKMQKNFYSVFRTEFDYYYLSVKTFITFLINAMERNNF